MQYKKLTLVIFIALFVYSCSFNQSIDSPVSKKIEQIDDPYIWLEDIEGEKSLGWVKAQNALSEQVITTHPLFETLRNRYLEVFNDKDKIAYPTIVGDYVYNLWQDEINERGVWRRMLKVDYINKKSDWEVILDIDELSKKENKKWVFNSAEWLAPDNTICLISISDGGKDEDELREFNVKTKEFVKNGFLLAESKGYAAWIDEDSLLISRDFGAGTLTNSGYPRIVKSWKRGTSIDDAEIIFEADTTVAAVWPNTFYSNNKQYAFIFIWVTSNETECYYISGNKLQKIDYPLDAEVSGFYKNQMILALQSDWNINNLTYLAGSLVSFDLDEFLSGKVNIKTIYYPDIKSSFISMSTTNDFIVVNTMKNVQNRLIKYRIENNKWIEEEVDAPEFGSIRLITSSDQSNDYFFQYSNFITPPTLCYGKDEDFKEIKKLKHVFNNEGLVIKQNAAISKDGTSIPYFIVHKSDLIMNGENPTLVYAYGGFNSSRQPSYDPIRGTGWLEQGGIYVLANIRGGGEFGPSWHKAAMKEKRQNAYDDFFAVTEDLIQKNITSPDYLGAFGWSNGGLLAGVVFTQRPDLYNAVVVAAPLLDMKRYSKMLAGASWMGEYGNPDIPEEWEYLKKYSPYHNVFKDKKYPEVLFITSIKDDRVHPGHARKMAAKMMDMGHPLLYHETIEGGHGAASTNKQRAEMFAIIFTYLNMKLNDKDVKKK